MESMEIALIKYNKKTWSKSGLLGFIIGLAIIVPGISGSTVAIIFKLYDQFLYALGNLFKKFKQCFLFLLPIAIGIVLGFLAGFFTVKQLLEIFPFVIICLFAGLMTGAFPAVKDEVKGAQITPKRLSFFFLGVLIPVLLGVVSVALRESSVAQSVNVGTILLGLPLGYLVAITQIVPGLSASAILMAIGWFGFLMDSVSLSFWTATPQIFLIYAMLGVGFLLGLLTFSKVLNFLFAKARQTSYFMIVGLSLGSIVSMFYNPDVFEIYALWAKSGVNWWHLIVGIGLFIVGGIISYLLVRYERKKAKSE